MKIFYDFQVFYAQKFGGISRYFCELMKHSKGLFDFSIGGIFSENEYAKELNLFWQFPIKRNFKGKWRLQKCINEKDSLKKLKGCDIIHPTYYDNYLLNKTNKPLVLTVYDFIHELYPNGFTNANVTIQNKKAMINRADRIIVISQNTKNDILKFYQDTPQEKIEVIYLGTSWQPIQKFNNLNYNSQYILFTGDRTFYKNFNNFILSIAPLLLKYNLKLKCTGKPFTKMENNLLKQQGIFEKTTVQFANETELKEFYANALCFVFPSLYEGFGIPLLESFACGCPTVISNASCFPEIAGDAAIYFDPQSIDDMRNKIEMVICSETLRKELAQNGFERLKQFSWVKCAKQTAKVYEKML